MYKFTNNNIVVKCPHCLMEVKELISYNKNVKCRCGISLTKSSYKNHKLSKRHLKKISTKDKQFKNLMIDFPYEIKLEILDKLLDLKKEPKYFSIRNSWGRIEYNEFIVNPIGETFINYYKDIRKSVIKDTSHKWFHSSKYKILKKLPSYKLLRFRLINKYCYEYVEKKFELSESVQNLIKKNTLNNLLLSQNDSDSD